MIALAATLAGLAVWIAFSSADRGLATVGRRPLLLAASGLAGWGAVDGWLPVPLAVVALVAAASFAGGWLVWRGRRDRRRRALTALGVLEACEVMAAELAAGRPPGHALGAAAVRWPDLAPVVEAWSLGSDVPGALRRLATAPGAGDLRIVASAWQVAHHSGNGLAHAVSRVAKRIRAQRQTQRVVASELASARATARLVAVLPVVALGMGSGAGGDPWAFLVGTPVGWACLASGMAFALVGLWWIEAIADRAEPS